MPVRNVLQDPAEIRKRLKRTLPPEFEYDLEKAEGHMDARNILCRLHALQEGKEPGSIETEHVGFFGISLTNKWLYHVGKKDEDGVLMVRVNEGPMEFLDNELSQLTPFDLHPDNVNALQIIPREDFLRMYDKFVPYPLIPEPEEE